MDPTTGTADPRRVRRDRHGRGVRGPLAPTSSPTTVSRAEQFGELVAAAVDRLEPRWGRHLSAVDIEIHDAPDVAVELGVVPLAASRPATRSDPPVVVVYRRPVELRAPDRPTRVDLVRDLVAEQLAEILGLSPGDLDPAYDDRSED